jgi:hypothetical protein
VNTEQVLSLQSKLTRHNRNEAQKEAAGLERDRLVESVAYYVDRLVAGRWLSTKQESDIHNTSHAFEISNES